MSPDDDQPGARKRRWHASEAGTRALLDEMALGDPADELKLGDIVAGLGRQVFGMLLFIATLPAFIPIPGVGGAIGGPLTVLIGAQLLIGMRKPWLPRFIAQRGPRRGSVQLFDRMLAPWLARLEHLFKPRMTGLVDHRAAVMFTGLLLVLLGVLLALPIPFTNYLFGGLLLAYAFALLERDGLLILLCWIAGIVAIAVFGVLSGALAAAATHWIGQLFT